MSCLSAKRFGPKEKREAGRDIYFLSEMKQVYFYLIIKGRREEIRGKSKKE